MPLTGFQRAFIADQRMGSANVALAGLAVGQLALIFLGLLLYLGGWLISVGLWKGVRRR
jgi:hypothetical protein